jgi:hypothetical protein
MRSHQSTFARNAHHGANHSERNGWWLLHSELSTVKYQNGWKKSGPHGDLDIARMGLGHCRVVSMTHHIRFVLGSLPWPVCLVGFNIMILEKLLLLIKSFQTSHVRL